MKREESMEVKLLHKKYPFMDKPNIKVLYEFCDENMQRTQKVLMIAKDIRSPVSIIKLLQSKPEKGNQLIESLQRRYEEQYGCKKQKNKAEQKSDNVEFFKNMPLDACLQIVMFLDPYSVAALAGTCRKWMNIGKSAAISDYYKLLCINLFQKFHPSLPEQCRFASIRHYVLENRKQFGPNIQNAVISNLRHYIWQRNIPLQKQPPSYYQQFGSYKQIYLKCPRINYNGFYIFKHQYKKQQQQAAHLVSYFRYMRFFEDGSVVIAFFQTKQKKEVLINLLSKQALGMNMQEQREMTMIGEFCHTGHAVSVKAVKSGTVFNYQLQLVENNSMLILKYYLRVIDKKEIIQVLEEHNPESPLYFKYCHCLDLGKENSYLIQSSGL